MSRTYKFSGGKPKEKKTKAYRKHKTEGPDRDVHTFVRRRGRPGVLSDDWDASSGVVDLYEYRISHEDEAA